MVWVSWVWVEVEGGHLAVLSSSSSEVSSVRAFGATWGVGMDGQVRGYALRCGRVIRELEMLWLEMAGFVKLANHQRRMVDFVDRVAAGRRGRWVWG